MSALRDLATQRPRFLCILIPSTIDVTRTAKLTCMYWFVEMVRGCADVPRAVQAQPGSVFLRSDHVSMTFVVRERVAVNVVFLISKVKPSSSCSQSHHGHHRTGFLREDQI